MTVTQTVLTGGSSTTDGTSFQTATITPAANNLILLCISGQSASAMNPVISGNGLTWVLIGNTSTGANVRTTFLYRAMGASPTAGKITISDSVTYTQLLWTVVQCGGVDTSGTNGSGAIVQSITGSQTAVTSFSTSLVSAITAGNASLAVVGCNNAVTISAGTNWTSIDQESQTSQTQGQMVEFAAAGQQACSGTFSASATSFVVGVEIKASSTTIGQSVLTGGSSNTDSTSYTTASITPAANAQVYVAVMTQPTGTGISSNPVVSGCNLTWTLVDATTGGAFTRTMTVWRGTGASPTTGVLTITDTATDTQCSWSVVQLTNQDPTTPVVQSVHGTVTQVTNPSLAFGAQVTAGNATLAFVGYNQTGTITAGTGWTSIDQESTTTGVQAHMAEYAATPQNSITAGFSPSGTAFIVGIEAKVVGGSSNVAHKFQFGTLDVGVQFGSSQANAVFFGNTQVWGPQPSQVPNAPTIGVATAGVQSASVGFVPSSSGPQSTSFTATSSPGSITGTGTQSPIVVNGLTAGQAYTFTVHATNAVGNSSESAASNSVTPTAPVAGSVFWGVGGFTQNSSAQQNALNLGYGVTPLVWRWYSTATSGVLAYPTAWTLRSGDAFAFSATRYVNPGPTVTTIKNLFNSVPNGVKFYYIPVHEPENNGLSTAVYDQLFADAMTAKNLCSHPQDIRIATCLVRFDWNRGNQEAFIPADQNFDVLGIDMYFGLAPSFPSVTTIASSFAAVLATAQSHGNKPVAIFEAGIGTDVTGQARLDALTSYSHNIHINNLEAACYYYASSTSPWYNDPTGVSAWVSGQTT